MRRTPWATYLWPGLPQLWHWGYWSGLALALTFGLALNLMVLASLVWVEWLGSLSFRLGWLAVGSVWAAAAIASAWSARGGAVVRGATSAEALFRDALSEYLLGSWFEAESILGRLLRLHPRDVEGRLLLATLLRHTRRYDQALDQLNRLQRLRDSEPWIREIAAERRKIAANRANPDIISDPFASDESQASTDSPPDTNSVRPVSRRAA